VLSLFSNAGAQTDHLVDEFVMRELIEFAVGSRHATSVAPTRAPVMPV
jgi:hypothetical protein